MISRRAYGFTIIELATIIAVIAILVTIGAVSYGATQRRAANTEIQNDLRQVALKLEQYKAKTGAYPANEAEVDDGRGLPRSIDARVYDYRSTAGAYCVSAIVERSGDTYKVEHDSTEVVQGDCVDFTG